MLTMLTVTFSALKGTAIAIAAVNAAVLAAALVCLILLYRSTKKEENDHSRSSFIDPTK